MPVGPFEIHWAVVLLTTCLIALLPLPENLPPASSWSSILGPRMRHMEWDCPTDLPTWKQEINAYYWTPLGCVVCYTAKGDKCTNKSPKDSGGLRSDVWVRSHAMGPVWVSFSSIPPVFVLRSKMKEQPLSQTLLIAWIKEKRTWWIDFKVFVWNMLLLFMCPRTEKMLWAKADVNGEGTSLHKEYSQGWCQQGGALDSLNNTTIHYGELQHVIWPLCALVLSSLKWE